MNYLLDTHTILWFLINSPQLSENSKKIIIDLNNNCFVSVASLWEIAIKYSLNKLQLTSSLEETFDIIRENQFSILPITEAHILELKNLPFHHRNPFDRIIIAQARTENLSFTTKDDSFTRYDVLLKWE